MYARDNGQLYMTIQKIGVDHVSPGTPSTHDPPNLIATELLPSDLDTPHNPFRQRREVKMTATSASIAIIGSGIFVQEQHLVCHAPVLLSRESNTQLTGPEQASRPRDSAPVPPNNLLPHPRLRQSDLGPAASIPRPRRALLGGHAGQDLRRHPRAPGHCRRAHRPAHCEPARVYRGCAQGWEACPVRETHRAGCRGRDQGGCGLSEACGQGAGVERGRAVSLSAQVCVGGRASQDAGKGSEYSLSLRVTVSLPQILPSLRALMNRADMPC